MEPRIIIITSHNILGKRLSKEVNVKGFQTVVSNNSDLTISEDDIIILDAHLGYKMSEFDGLNIYNSIRRKRVNKIILFSWYDENKLIESGIYYKGDYTPHLFMEEKKNSIYLTLPLKPKDIVNFIT